MDRWKCSAIAASGVVFVRDTSKQFAIPATCCGNVPVCGVTPDLVLLKLVASLWWTAALDSLDCDHWPLVQLPLVVMRPILFGHVRKTKLNCLLSLNRHLTSSIPTRHGHGIKKLGLPSKDPFLASRSCTCIGFLFLFLLFPSTTWNFYQLSCSRGFSCLGFCSFHVPGPRFGAIMDDIALWSESVEKCCKVDVLEFEFGLL